MAGPLVYLGYLAVVTLVAACSGSDKKEPESKPKAEPNAAPKPKLKRPDAKAGRGYIGKDIVNRNDPTPFAQRCQLGNAANSSKAGYHLFTSSDHFTFFMSKDFVKPDLFETNFKILQQNLESAYKYWICTQGYSLKGITSTYNNKVPVYLDSKGGSARGGPRGLFFTRSYFESESPYSKRIAGTAVHEFFHVIQLYSGLYNSYFVINEGLASLAEGTPTPEALSTSVHSLNRYLSVYRPSFMTAHGAVTYWSYLSYQLDPFADTGMNQRHFSNFLASMRAKQGASYSIHEALTEFFDSWTNFFPNLTLQSPQEFYEGFLGALFAHGETDQVKFSFAGDLEKELENYVDVWHPAIKSLVYKGTFDTSTEQTKTFVPEGKPGDYINDFLDTDFYEVIPSGKLTTLEVRLDSASPDLRWVFLTLKDGRVTTSSSDTLTLNGTETKVALAIYFVPSKNNVEKIPYSVTMQRRGFDAPQ